MSPERLARWERRLRPLLIRLPPALAVRLYSAGRRRFLRAFEALPAPAPVPPPPDGLTLTLWGLVFRLPIGNAAGMFKTGGGYPRCAAQGAGFYLAGTSTAKARAGNRGHGVRQPFAPYPRSGAAANWLGLPNEGHGALARRLATLARRPGCPLGASLAADPRPDIDEAERLAGLLAGLRAFEQAGVDFLELNESCPNTGDPAADACQLDALERRLAALAAGFLARRRRRLPVLVKLSCDTAPAQVPALVERLVAHGFDGAVFGNTSTAYARHRPAIDPRERRLYDAFAARWGGGVSGRPLGADSLALVRAAAAALAAEPPGHEFHVVRTGGVESAADVADGLAAGAALCQWYTGYFDAFARHGHGVYRALGRQLAAASGRAAG